MLRSLVLILLLLNLAFFSWTQGWLTTVVGVHPLPAARASAPEPATPC